MRKMRCMTAALTQSLTHSVQRLPLSGRVGQLQLARLDKPAALGPFGPDVAAVVAVQHLTVGAGQGGQLPHEGGRNFDGFHQPKLRGFSPGTAFGKRADNSGGLLRIRPR